MLKGYINTLSTLYTLYITDMITSEKQGFVHLLKIAFPFAIATSAYATLFLIAEEILGDKLYTAGQLGAVFGMAVAFFLGFRMNSAYDRWWEARKIFGELTNNSRSFANKIYAYYSNEKNVSKADKFYIQQLISLEQFYVKQLTNEIKNRLVKLSDEEQQLFTLFSINSQNKISNEILMALSIAFEKDFHSSAFSEKADLMQHINRFYDIQGKAERIKNTPFLKIYSAFTRLIVWVYVALIPLFIGDIDLGGENSHLEFLTIPIVAMISTAFLTINRLANLYGEPFLDSKTSISVDKICQTIVQNCDEVKNKLNTMNQ